MVVLDLAMALREQYKSLTPGERAHLKAILKKSQGRPSNLTKADRDDLRRMVRKMDPKALGRAMLPFGGGGGRRKRRG
jgi:flagellar motility protein MotE (MotC chaperone)